MRHPKQTKTRTEPSTQWAAARSLAVLTSLLLAACGSGGDDSGSVPGAPTIGTATPGNASASIAFTGPALSGSSAILGYTATCAAGSTVRSGIGTTSPVVVDSLTNGSAYSCFVTASNDAGTGPASAAVVVTPVATASTGNSTAAVLCSYSQSTYNSSASVNATSTSAWRCDGTTRVLTANGLPDHAVGTFPNPDNPNTITAQSVTASYTLAPAVVSSTGTPATVIGFALNGIKMDPGTGGTCDNTGTTCDLGGGNGTWRIEALGQTSFKFGTDFNNAHVQPGGAYHYHGMPEGYLTKLAKGMAMTLVGWAGDGFPVYARYGYSSASDASSSITVLKGSYQLKSMPDANRPATSLYPMGAFNQDYQYVAGSGDLDQCNGRTGVTPEFPGGTYYYAITDTYPFIQRCLKGTAVGGPGGPPPAN